MGQSTNLAPIPHLAQTMMSSIPPPKSAEEENKKAAVAAGLSTIVPIFPPDKKPRLENSDSAATSSYFAPLQPQPPQISMPLLPPTTMQPTSQSNQIQPSFASPPPRPPPPLSVQSSSLPDNQFVHPTGLVSGVMPFQYKVNLPPPPPLPPHIPMGLARPGLQPPQKQQTEQPQQQPGTGGFYQPQGVGFFGQGHQRLRSNLFPGNEQECSI